MFPANMVIFQSYVNVYQGLDGSFQVQSLDPVILMPAQPAGSDLQRDSATEVLLRGGVQLYL